MPTYTLFFLALCFPVFGICQQETKLSDCMKKEIAAFADRKICDSGQKVMEYSFQNKKVYVFEPGNCGADLTAMVRSETCEVLGELGGFTGNTMINGANFNQAELIRVVWERTEK